MRYLSLPYFIAIAIDAIGFTIIAPVLIPLTNHVVNNSGLSQHLLYGTILAIYSLSFMIGAPILGALSDLLGRRKVLIIASIGVLLGYTFYAFS
ncbi:MAG TPA: MFS transporter, partial [Coxiellaceae bacterium]|nr:MFS transporter [Coxiellaceae bacterium]